MKFLSFGSLNYDYIYSTPHFTLPKETQTSLSFSRGFGGKGLNQSIALSKAGAEVYHAGRVGSDGQPFFEYLQSFGVNTEHLLKDDSLPTGHAIIEVSGGDNRIILYPGANQVIDRHQVDLVLDSFGKDDILLIQNEISCIPYLMKSAKEKGMYVFFNAAPMNDEVFDYPLHCADIICVNEVEGKALARTDEHDAGSIGHILRSLYPGSGILLTNGEHGSYYYGEGFEYYQPAERVDPVDTTAAGDTYIGYFLKALSSGKGYAEAMETASLAAALSVQRHGAAASIPMAYELR